MDNEVSPQILHQRERGLDMGLRLLAANQDMWFKVNDGDPWLATAQDVVQYAEVFRRYLFEGVVTTEVIR